MAGTSAESDALCRACMAQLGAEKFDILQSPETAELYTRLSCSYVDASDFLPKSICTKCYDLLKDFDRFQTMCAESYKLLLVKFTKIIVPKVEGESDNVKVENMDPLETMECEEDDENFCDDEDIDATYDPLKDDGVDEEDEDEEEFKIDIVEPVVVVKEEVPVLVKGGQEEEVQVKATRSRRSTRQVVKESRGVDKGEEKADELDDDDEEEEEEEKKQKEPKAKGRPKPFACDKCPKTFYKKDRYDGHMRVHSGLKPFACPDCDKQYSKSTRLNNHRINEHSNNPVRYSCTYEGCDKMYRNRESLSSHESKIHGPPKPEEEKAEKSVFICELCGKALSSRGVLRKHSMIHKDEYPFACDQCPKKYRTHHRLSLHTMRHKGIKNHECRICGLKKTTGHELNVHMNVHTREKKYPCKLCSACFLNNGNLVRHIKVVHNGIKTYACTFCDLSFGKAETLKHHVMRHTGEKPHECPICGRRFIQKTSFQLHVKRHDKANAKRRDSANAAT